MRLWPFGKKHEEPPVWWKEIHIHNNGEITATLQSEELVGFVARLTEAFFNNHGGKNYCGYSAWSVRTGAYEVVVRKIIGKTPSIIADELRVENVELRQEIERLTKPRTTAEPTKEPKSDIQKGERDET